MQEIDLASWPRREHFVFFRRADLPFYNINTQVDITGVREYAKGKSLSFNSLLIHLVTRSINRIENHRYRVYSEKVILHDCLHPSFAHLGEGEDLFSFVTADFSDDVRKFDCIVREVVARRQGCFDMQKVVGRDDFIFYSALPWLSFTRIDHKLGLNRDDATPRLTWGRFYEVDGKTCRSISRSTTCLLMVSTSHACSMLWLRPSWDWDYPSGISVPYRGGGQSCTARFRLRSGFQSAPGCAGPARSG